MNDEVLHAGALNKINYSTDRDSKKYSIAGFAILIMACAIGSVVIAIIITVILSPLEINGGIFY